MWGQPPSAVPAARKYRAAEPWVEMTRAADGRLAGRTTWKVVPFPVVAPPSRRLSRGRSRPRVRGQDGLGTASRMPALQRQNLLRSGVVVDFAGALQRDLVV